MKYYYHMRDTVKNNVTLVPDIFQVREEYMKISVYMERGIADSAATGRRGWRPAYSGHFRI